jgi:hypothetical protein
VGWTTRVRFPVNTGKEFFLFATASLSALGPFSVLSNGFRNVTLRVKRSEHEADHSPPILCRGHEFLELYLHSPTCLHGLVLSYAQGQVVYLRACIIGLLARIWGSKYLKPLTFNGLRPDHRLIDRYSLSPTASYTKRATVSFAMNVIRSFVLYWFYYY